MYEINYVQKKSGAMSKWVLLALALFPLLPIKSFGIPLYSYIPQIIMGIMAIICMYNNNFIIPHFLGGWLLYYVLIYCFGIVSYNGNIGVAFLSGLRILYPVLAFIIGYYNQKTIGEKTLFWIMQIQLILEAILAVLNQNSLWFRNVIIYLFRSDSEAYLNNYQYSYASRSIATLGNPNMLGIFCVMIYIFLLLQSKIYEGMKRLILIFISSICVVLVCIYTQSRTSIVLLVIVTLGALGKYYFKKYGLGAPLFFPFIAIIGWFLFNIIQNSIYRSVNVKGLGTRELVWNNILNDNWNGSVIRTLFGIGYQNSRKVSFYDNIYLKYLIATGIIGLVFYIITILMLMYKCKKMHNTVGLALLSSMLIVSYAMDFQENFKIAFMFFFIIGYYMSNEGEEIDDTIEGVSE